MRRNRNFKKKTHSNSNDTTLAVTAEECNNNIDRMIRKFTKKVKKEGIIEEVRNRKYYKKPTAVRTEEKRNRKRLIEKINKERSELLIPSHWHKKRSK
jgi:ribosomal protein S21